MYKIGNSSKFLDAKRLNTEKRKIGGRKNAEGGGRKQKVRFITPGTIVTPDKEKKDDGSSTAVAAPAASYTLTQYAAAASSSASGGHHRLKNEEQQYEEEGTIHGGQNNNDFGGVGFPEINNDEFLGTMGDILARGAAARREAARARGEAIDDAMVRVPI